MGTKQRDAAQQEMIKWLSGPQGLGRMPAQIECIGTFDLQGLRYYIFRYKKKSRGNWVLSVCGGYEGESLDHCGHLFSDEEEHEEKDVKKYAAQLVQHVRQYWAGQAQKEEEYKKKPGNFVNLVLLEEVRWDKQALGQELEERWNLKDDPQAHKGGEKAAEARKNEGNAGGKPQRKGISREGDSFVLHCEGAVVTVTMIPNPVPGDEVEYGARKNYTWKNASTAVKRHRAYLTVEVVHGRLSSVDSGILLVKTVTACCEQPGVIGVCANGTVYQKEQYKHFSGMVRAGAFPIQNLIWFGHYNGKKGLCGYTFGLSQFGYDEVEVLNSSASETELDDFLFALTNHIIYHNVVLRHGEVIGFQAWQKLPITKSRGVAVPGESLKIVFPSAKTT